MRALPPERVPQQLQTEVLRSAARTVVLIDEIDKAPRDFPNDLLNEIEQMHFRIPELDNIQVGGPRAITGDFPHRRITSTGEESSRPVSQAMRLLPHPVSHDRSAA